MSLGEAAASFHDLALLSGALKQKIVAAGVVSVIMILGLSWELATNVYGRGNVISVILIAVFSIFGVAAFVVFVLFIF